jgi:hypothetical protein
MGFVFKQNSMKIPFLPSPLASKDLNCAKNKIVIIINRHTFFKIQSNEFFYYKTGLIHINFQYKVFCHTNLPYSSPLFSSCISRCFIFQELLYLFGTFGLYIRDLNMFNMTEAMALSVLCN